MTPSKNLVLASLVLNLARASRTLLGVVLESAPGVADFGPLESRWRAKDEADPMEDATLEVDTLFPGLGSCHPAGLIFSDQNVCVSGIKSKKISWRLKI